MNNNSLKSGICPKCGGKDVYSDKDKARHNERGFMMVSPATGYKIDTYVCLNCGYFEEYFNDEEFKDEKTKKKMLEKWTKINP
jgi:predicted nucleic-acid-binding Zn-ribbon protein